MPVMRISRRGQRAALGAAVLVLAGCAHGSSARDAPAATAATQSTATTAATSAFSRAPAPIRVHPRILLDGSILARLRERARRLDPAWLALRSRCDAYRPTAVQWPDGNDYPDSGGIGEGYQGDGYYPALLDIGLCYEVARGTDGSRAARYGALGADVLRHMSEPSGSHAPDTLRDSGYGVRYYASGMAIGYDWLFAALDAGLRARVAAAIERWLADFRRAGFERSFPQGNYFAGYYAADAYAGMALAGDTTAGEALLSDWFDRVHGRMVQPYYAANLVGGGWPEGWNYGPIASVNMSLPAVAARTATGVDLVHGSHPYLFPVTNPRFLLYFTWPDMTTVEDSSALYSSENPSIAAPWLFATESGVLAALHDPFAPVFHSFARAARSAQPGGQLGGDWDLWENLLFWDNTAPERSYVTLPRSYYARGIEMVAMRSDWSANAVWGAFKSGPYINYPENGEEYFDKGSLSIVNGNTPFLVNANGALLRDTPSTSDGDRFYQPIYDDLFSDSGRNRDIFNVFYVGRPSPWGQANRLRSDGARTRIAGFHDGGSYVSMSGTHLEDEYPQSGARTIRSWTRTVLYVRPATFVVYDRTSVTDAAIDQWLAFHLGGRAVGVPSGTGGVDRYDVTGLRGYAGSVDTVLPAGHADSVSALFGSTKVDRLEIRPGAAGRNHQWLTVFDAAASASRAAQVAPVPATGAQAGVLIRRAGTNTAVLLGTTMPVDVAYRRPPGSTLNLVTGLTPRAAYSVRVDGGMIRIRAGSGQRADSGGSLAFRTSAP
jgi:hypothetical protein